jgi:large subunit ribosomal protein L21
MERITMYAVFRAGGKQYRASKGERLKLEKFAADEGANVEFDQVLLVGEGKDVKVGSPLLDGGIVSAKVLRQGKSGKVTVTKFRRRQNYLRQHTHRQWFTEVEITGISGAGVSTEDSTATKTESKSAAAPRTASKKTTKKKASKKKTTTKAASASSSGSKTAKTTSKKKAAKKKASD